MIYKGISNPARYMIILALTVLGFSIKVKAQMVGPDAYVKANHLEIGIDGSGGFEGADMTASPPLAGMHPRAGSPATSYFGFVANPQLNSWATFDGDFFTPGSPENGWGFEIGSSSTSRGNNCNFLNQINGAITGWSHNAICYSVDWEGNFTAGTNLHFKINYFLQENDLYYTTTVSITNNTAANIPDMYYYRNLDPDNNQALSGDYDTQNTIVSQPGTGCNLAHVSATQSSPWNSYLGLAAIGANWRADYGGFSNRDASDLWTGSGFTQAAGSSNFADEAIALAYRIQNLAPGATETFKFVVILDNASANNAINNLLYFSYPGAAGAPSSGCSAVSDTVRTCGSPVTIAVQGSNVADYTWSWSPSIGLSSTTGSSTSANPATTTTYTASGTPLSACISPVTMSVVVEVTPGGASPVISPVAPLCISSPPLNLTADSTGGTWSGTGITNDSIGTFDPTVSGIGTFQITYTTPGGCSTVDTVMITVGNTYDATIIHPASICISGSPVTLTSVTSGGTWSGTGTSSAGVFDPTAAGLGFHVITYSISGVCADTDTDSIEVTSLFDATITPVADVCRFSGTFTLMAAHPGGYWSGPGVIDSVNGTFNPAGLGMQTVVYTIPGSCGNADTMHFNIIPTPDVTINYVPPVCLSSPPITLTADSTGGTWAGVGITNASLGTFSPAAAGLGTHLITYSTTGLCNTLDSVYILVTTFSDATITQPYSLCVTGSVTTFSAVTPGGVWTGTGITPPSNTTGAFDPSVAGVGTHLITYTIGGSCANQDTMLVDVVTIFDATITQPSDVCLGSPSFDLVAAHPGGTFSGTNITDATNGTFAPVSVGSFPVTYTITGVCANSSSINVNVLPNADATITAVPAMCFDASPVTLSAVTSGGSWTGTGITNSSAGIFDPASSGSGTFIITYGVGGACGDTATQSLTVNPLPVPVFTSDVTSGCDPLCVQFSEASSPTCSSIHYDFGDGDTANVSSPYHCYDSTSVFHVSVMCIDMNGCRGTTVDSNMITVNPVPTAEFVIAPVPEAAISTTVTFTNQSTAGTSSLWTFGDGSPFNNSSVIFNTSHVYAATGTMCATLIATTPAGCSDTISHCVDVVDPSVVPPNIFTPNGDGENDTWTVRCSGIREFNCAIFDRWGIKMGELNSVSEAEAGWPGKTKGGSPCHDGTYYYVIKAVTLLDKNVEMAGYFQLLGN